MAKADLHLHSKYSDYPSTWAHKLYDSPESYTEPEEIYRQAKSRGMDFVTITDHDDIRGALELVAAHPEDCFISCEVTAYFPEDSCKVHILVYDITEDQYDRMMQIRRDVYLLANYIQKEAIAHSVAHAAYDQDGKLKIKHIEKLALLFNTFETRNGASAEQSNTLVHQYLQDLTPKKVNALKRKHHIETDKKAWIKGFTGGSDDHCGILIGSTFTEAKASNKKQFIEQLKVKNTLCGGMHGSFEIYAIGVFKHIHDYQKHTSSKYLKTKTFVVFEQLFTGYRGNWLDRLKSSRSLKYLKHKSTDTHSALFNMLRDISEHRHLDMSEKIPLLFDNCIDLQDILINSVIKALTKDLEKGNLFSVFNNLSRVFPALALAAPFVGSLRHQVVKNHLKADLQNSSQTKVSKRALWFTDTIDDLNGVSVSLRQVARYAADMDYQLKLVVCVDKQSLNTPIPDNHINLRRIREHTFSFYDDLSLNFPSLLDSLKRILEEQPDEIIVSTPGPVGAIGLLFAKLLDIPVKGVYHTDFGQQIQKILGNNQLGDIVDRGVNLFYKQLDQTFVPSQSYIEQLNTAGIDRAKLTIFPRGFDNRIYQAMPKVNQLAAFPKLKQLNGTATIITAGRISADKNVQLVCDAYDELLTRGLNINLIIAGDGPDLRQFSQRYAKQPNVFLTGRVKPELMPALYSFADLQVFPSRTDTFGMVVLEGQACGLPTLVSNRGGPKEIINDQKTGLVIPTDDPFLWADHIEAYLKICHDSPVAYAKLRKTCQQHIEAKYSWESVLKTMFGSEFQNVISVKSNITPLFDKVG